MYEIISGAIMMSCFVVALFFIKFWRKTSDRLFIYFSAAFILLAFERLVLGYIGTQNEPSPRIYLIRLSSFILILLGIFLKNLEVSKNNSYIDTK